MPNGQQYAAVLRHTTCVALVIGMALVPWAQEPWPWPPNPPGTRLLPVLEVLEKARLSGSLVFSGQCVGGRTPDLPNFRTAEARDSSVLQKLRSTFPDRPVLEVTEEDGIVRVVEQRALREVLDVRISHISFEQPVYDTIQALRIVFQAPEVKEFMNARGYSWPPRNLIAARAPGNLYPPPDQPHVSGTMENVTVSEALDRILKTFPGVWVYENCPQTTDKARDIYIGFFSLGKLGSIPVVVH